MRYFDEVDFVVTAGPTATRRDIQLYLQQIESSRHVPNAFNAALARQQFESLVKSPDGLADAAFRSDVMKAYYTVHAHAHPLSRGAAMVCYGIAFTCLAVPSGHTFFSS